MAGTELPLAEELAELAARMSPLLLSADTVTAAVETLTSLAADAIPCATGAGVSLMDASGTRTSTGATSHVVMTADNAQYRLNEGPCLTAWAERRVVRTDDLATDARWPRWAEAVRPLPVRSVVSAPLVGPERVLGAVKVYSDAAGAFGVRTEGLLSGFADAATALLANVVSVDNERRLSGGLQQAMQERDILQLAKGVVMQRDGLSEQAAFQWLVSQAGAGQVPLHDLAASIVGTRPARLTEHA